MNVVLNDNTAVQNSGRERPVTAESFFVLSIEKKKAIEPYLGD